MIQARKSSTGMSNSSLHSPRACERVESYIFDFTEVEDVERVRRLYKETGDLDLTMRLATQLKVSHRKK